MINKIRSNPFISLLLAIQIIIMIWNAIVYPSHEQYDMTRHFTSVANGGLLVSVRNFDPPLYYMFALPFLMIGEFFNIQILKDLNFLIPLMKAYNVLIICFFNLIWIYYIFPRLIYDKLARNIAGILLLALPGFEKIAVMIHADNLFTLLTTLIFAILLNETIDLQSWRGVLIFSILLSMVAFTRPFGVVPVAFFGVFWLQKSIRFTKLKLINPKQILFRGIVLLFIVMIPISSWWAIRFQKTAHWINISTPTVHEKYSSRQNSLRYDFYLEYLTTFYYKQLIQIPNRYFAEIAPGDSTNWVDSLNNSLWTVAYSDFWGDHWLYYSGPKYIEGKLWPKRILFVFALPITVAVFLSFTKNAALELIKIFRNKLSIDYFGLSTLIVIAGFGIWLFWQTFLALEPGKISTNKFIYNAYYIPFVIPVALANISKAPRFMAICHVTSIILYMLTLPISIYWH